MCPPRYSKKELLNASPISYSHSLSGVSLNTVCSRWSSAKETNGKKPHLLGVNLTPHQSIAAYAIAITLCLLGVIKLTVQPVSQLRAQCTVQNMLH